MKVRPILSCLTFFCSARWVSKHLTEGHKCNYQHICCSLLEQFNHKCDNFLNCIISGYETWLRHHGPETKWWSMQWKHTFFFQKIRITSLFQYAFVDSVLGLPRVYPWTLYRRSYIGNSVNNCYILRNVLRLAVSTKWRGCSGTWQGKPHVQHHWGTKLRCSRTPCPQSKYGPFWFPSIWPVRNAVRVHRLADDEVKEAVHDPLHNQSHTFLSDGMKKLADCWVQCIEKKGEYIENKCSSNFCSKYKNCWQSKAWKLFEVPLCEPPH